MLRSVDIVIPTLNEARALPRSIPTLHAFASNHLHDHRWNLIIVDNGSSDGSADIAQAIAATLPHIRVLTLPQPGRGRALRTAWLESTADIVSYMDIDLSSDLSVLPHLIQQVAEGADIAVGSRHLRASRVSRSLHRSVLSLGYNLATRTVLGTRFSDAQCGIKALTTAAAHDLLPRVHNEGWFFDTELLALAEALGYQIAELPVTWTEDSDSRVRLLPTVLEDLAGLGRLRLRDLPATRALQNRKGAPAGALSADSG